MRGVGLFESNFMGRLETLISAVAWTNADINYFLIYKSENFFSPNFGISALVVHLYSTQFILPMTCMPRFN